MNKINNIIRRKFLEIFCTCICALMIASCSTAPITERKQLKLIPESTLNNQAAQIYEKVKQKTKLSDDKKKLDEIKEIGSSIENAVSAYFDSINKADPTTNFQWEYILVDNDKIKNAWCMPGGKIAIYTGILEITKNKDALATIMGHEIAHAVAKHSVERMSQAMALNVTTQIVDIFTGGKISQTRRAVGRSTGMDIFQLGIMNPFGRKQETEADYLGLIFSSLSGFNIKESVKLWERMRDANKGKEPPQFLSTHPSSKNRIQNLKNWVNRIILEYPPMNT